jgi:DNA repair ATPase RecN
LVKILENSTKSTLARNIFHFGRHLHVMPFGIDKLGKKMGTLEQTTGKLEKSINLMTCELNEFKVETKNLTDQVKSLKESIGKLSQIFEKQMSNLTDSMQTLGKNLTQNVVDNILSLPKMFTKKRDPSSSNSK